MPTLYHLSRTTGEAVPCNARQRACPNGGQHFTSKAEAMLHLAPEYKLGSSGWVVAGVKPRGEVTPPAPAPTRAELLERLEAAAANKAAPKGQLAALKSQILSGIDGVIHASGLFYDEELDGIIYSIRKGDPPHSRDLYRDDILDAPVKAPRPADAGAVQGELGANTSYADTLKGIDISNVRGVLPYTDDEGRFVKRSVMVERVEALERTQPGWFTTSNLRRELKRADATRLRAMKSHWAKVNDNWRAEHGAAARPDFAAMLAEHEEKVAEAKVQRAAAEDSIPLSLHSFFGVGKKADKSRPRRSTKAAVESDVVPANAIGEFFGEKLSAAREELRDQRAYLKEEFNDFFNRG